MRAARRARRFALLTLLAIVLIVALALTAFGGTSRPVQPLAVANLAASAQTKPFPQIVAMHGFVRLQMPVAQNQLTAIGYHSGTAGAMTLHPVGHQGNEGVLQRVVHKIFGGGGGSPTWYQLDGGALSALDVGAAPGTNVVSGATRLGTVVNLAKVERQALARYTNDDGNHVSIELRPAASLVLN